MPPVTSLYSSARQMPAIQTPLAARAGWLFQSSVLICTPEVFSCFYLLSPR